jgi:betaine-aldehyde dehydrogenase
MKTELFIDGAWRPASGGATFPVIDPATEAPFAEAARGTAADVDLAVQAARRAFDDGPWPRMGGRERAAIVRAIGRLIAERKEELAALEVRDNGKPLPEALWDVGDAAYCFEYYADMAEAAEAAGPMPIPLGDARFTSKVVHEPLGVVGAIVPWNYPLLMAAWKVAPALAAGCTIVLKPSELTPMTAVELAQDRRGRRPAEGRLQPRHRHRPGGRRSRSPNIPASTRSPSPARCRPAAR